MDGLISLVVFWFIIRFILSVNAKAKKEGAKSSAPSRSPQETRAELNRRREARQERYRQRKAARKEETNAFPVSFDEAFEDTEENAAADSHVIHHPDEAMYAGSMNAHTGEGEDPCHDHEVEMPVARESEIFAFPEETVSPVAPLNWGSRDQLVNAFIMKEVLDRPRSMKHGR